LEQKEVSAMRLKKSPGGCTGPKLAKDFVNGRNGIPEYEGNSRESNTALVLHQKKNSEGISRWEVPVNPHHTTHRAAFILCSQIELGRDTTAVGSVKATRYAAEGSTGTREALLKRAPLAENQ